MSTMSSNFDELIQDQVEEFNQRMEASSNFHRYVLQMLCTERARRDFETRPDRASVSGLGRSRARTLVLRRIGKAGKMGQSDKQPVVRVLSPEPAPPTTRDGRPGAYTEEHQIIIEGEFRVINDDADVADTA